MQRIVQLKPMKSAPRDGRAILACRTYIRCYDGDSSESWHLITWNNFFNCWFNPSEEEPKRFDKDFTGYLDLPKEVIQPSLEE